MGGESTVAEVTPASEAEPARDGSGGRAWLVASIAGLPVLATTLVTGVRHDYRAYVSQWQSVAIGAEATDGSSAYGPLHHLFAFPASLWPLLPKVVFALMAVTAAGILMRKGSRSGALPGWAVVAIVLAAFLLNPLVVLSSYVYGQNDIVAAFFVVLALAARDADRPGLAGLCVGLASLEKLYPIVLAGYLMLEGGRVVRLRVPTIAAATLGSGLALSYVAWGGAAFSPISYASGREAKMLSVYRFLTCHPQLVGGDVNLATLLDTNVYVVLTAAASALLALHWMGARWGPSGAIGLLVVLLSYKVGHPQFYVTWLIPLTWLLLAGDAQGADTKVGIRLVPIVIYLALFQIVYARTLAMLHEWAFLRCYVSLPLAAIACVSIALSFMALRPAPDARTRLCW